MKKKYALVVPCIAVLAIGAFAFNHPSPHPAANAGVTQERPAVPEHIVYRHLFHHTAILSDRADEMDRQGQDGSSLRSVFQRQAALDDGQALILNRIALDCEREVKQQDARAKVIIDAYRAQYPGGRVPSGQTPAPPPPELAGMQAERNAIILRARDRLREAFGEDEFHRFEEFIKNHLASNIRTIVPSQPQPALRPDGR